MFKLVSPFQLAGSQIDATKKLIEGVRDDHKRNQTLLGVTGSGKTFTMANVIKELKMPTLVMAPNKILSAQLYEEFKQFFPENAVEYFVSYYDYYRPEAYIPQKGLYIEKEASVNEIIDQMRHKATRSLVERDDVIIVASVSCIYGIGSYEAYSSMSLKLNVGDKITSAELTRKLCELTYTISSDIARGKIVVRGQTIWVGPAHIQDRVWRFTIDKGTISSITELDALTRQIFMQYTQVTVFPNSHHITPEYSLSHAINGIQTELAEYIPQLMQKGKIAEAQRIEERVKYDLAQLKANYTCAGIENYSRFFTGRCPGTHPPTFLEYMGKYVNDGEVENRDFLLIVDESHISVPQIGGMAAGDASRKNVLIEHGFRLPSALDNRPMTFDEWDKTRSYTIFVSATPGSFELEHGNIVEQIIRPTGLVDPVCVLKPTENQVEDAINEAKEVIERGDRVLMLTLTKKTAEHLSEYLHSKGMKAAYLHGELTTLERIEKLYQFRKGEIDIIIGVNLLREGIDVPECALICIFEADHAGFLRTTSSLIQMIGRAARHDLGKVVLYGDIRTQAINDALKETDRRRNIQLEYNKAHNITPKKIEKEISQAFVPFLEGKKKNDVLKPEWVSMKEKERIKLIKQLEVEMKQCAANMDFEKAALLRDQRNKLMEIEMSLASFGNLNIDDLEKMKK